MARARVQTKRLPLEEIKSKFGDGVVMRLGDENHPRSHGELRLVKNPTAEDLEGNTAPRRVGQITY